MNYKDTVARFDTELRRQSYNRRVDVQKMKIPDIMYTLSAAQQYLGETYGVNERTYSLDLVADQSRYTIGTNSTNIPPDLLQIKTASINDNPGTKIEITSKEVIDSVYKIQGLPSKLTIYGVDGDRVLEIDSIPGSSYDVSGSPDYRINLLYKARLELFDSTAGTPASISFPTFDLNEADYGGTWSIPESWHSLIVSLAIADIFPDMKQEAIQRAERLNRDTKPKYVQRDMPYHLGGI